MRYNEKGFTLIETMVVLSVFILVTTLFTISIRPLHNHFSQTLFFQQLKKDLYYTKAYALSHSSSVKVVFIPEEYRYYATSGVSNRILDRTYPSSVQMINTTFRSFTYYSNGNVSGSNSFYFQIDSTTYQFVMYLGRGRFKINEL